MCQIYNTIGSLTTIKSLLEQNNINDFKSLKDVIDFQNSFSSIKQNLISYHENLIEQEKNTLKKDLEHLELEIITQRLYLEKYLSNEIEKLKDLLNIYRNKKESNLFRKLLLFFKQRSLTKKIKLKENNFDFDLQKSISITVNDERKKKERYQFINTQFYDAVNQSSKEYLSELERKKAIVDKLNSFIYGAIGEQKVVKALETLPDDYILINDFSLSFSPAINYKQENEYIKSIQIDHILIAPSGIFLIETKNWSEKSLANISLRSPVSQIKRASYVLFKLLNIEMSNFHLHINKHHWGDKKISIKNLIVLINTKPKEEFQFVKILTLNELLGYINYFKPLFSNFETQQIAEFLIKINESKSFKTT
jgi:hypothetical protein